MPAGRQTFFQRHVETVLPQGGGGQLLLADLAAIDVDIGVAGDRAEADRQADAIRVRQVEVDPVLGHAPALLALLGPVLVDSHGAPPLKVGGLFPTVLLSLVLQVETEVPGDGEIVHLSRSAERPVEH